MHKEEYEMNFFKESIPIVFKAVNISGMHTCLEKSSLSNRASLSQSFPPFT